MTFILPNNVSPIERQGFVMIMFFSFLGKGSHYAYYVEFN